MKLAFVEVAGFRGVRDRLRVEIPTSFAVVTGRNGVGKSTLLDAIDFALTGTISKYGVRNAKGGGLEDHIWWVGKGIANQSFVRAGFVRNDGSPFVVTRDREKGADKPDREISQELSAGPYLASAATLMQTALIRDERIADLSLDLPEQQRFAAVQAAIGDLGGPDHSARTSAVVNAAKSEADNRRRRLESLRVELSRALSALTEAQSAADKERDVVRARELLVVIEPDLAGADSQRIRARLTERRVAARRIQSALAELEAADIDRVGMLTPDGLLRAAEAEERLTSAMREETSAIQRLARAQEALDAERKSDAIAAHLHELLVHGERLGLQHGHCPLCDAERPQDAFHAALTRTRVSLGDRYQRIEALMARVEELAQELVAANAAKQAAVAVVESMRAERQAVAAAMERALSALAEAGLAEVHGPVANVRRAIFSYEETTAQLEQSLFTLEASLAFERAASLDAQVAKLRGEVDAASLALTSAERGLAAARSINESVAIVANQVLSEQFDTVLPLLKELYRRLRPHSEWNEIEAEFGGKIRASLNFMVEGGHNPQFMFSSGQRRAAGLAFLLAIHLSRPWCRWDTLLMDDPVQHIDDYRAVNLVEVLSAIRRTGRQVIVAVEDSALADLLCRRLRAVQGAFGRRIELASAPDGSVGAKVNDIFPMTPRALRIAEAS